MFHLLVALLLSNSYANSFSNLDLHDVSVLLPLPAVDQWGQLPQPQTVGARGVLLPETYFKRIPPLMGVPTNEMLYADHLRVVGIRFDPCFHEGPSPIQCKTQIRMVWQPLEAIQGITSTMDSSLHVFYDISPDEFKELLTQISQLKNERTDIKDKQPLTVNPYLKKDGLQSEYSKKLMQIVLQYVGEKNLTRITFMQLFMNKVVWDFGGFDFKNGEAVPVQVARVFSRIQRFVNQATTPAPVWFFGGMVPEPKGDDVLNILIKDSRKLGPENEAEIISSVRAAFRMENPTTHNPGTVDCVSCHVAQTARRWAVRQYPWLDLERQLHPEIYKSDRNMMNVSPMQPHTDIVRAFGYFNNQPIVAQRTINETAEVIKYINSNIK